MVFGVMEVRPIYCSAVIMELRCMTVLLMNVLESAAVSVIYDSNILSFMRN